MKELDQEAAAGKKSEKDAPAEKSHVPATPAKDGSVAGSTGSEEDGVLVEEGGPSSPTSPQPTATPTTPGGGGGGKKKKKGKK